MMDAKIILLMGVSSCGKTTVGERLSQHFGWPFYDGDSFHPAANVEKMRSGVPLTDEDRLPWLQGLREKMDGERKRGRGAIFACSALKERYRDILVGGKTDTILIHLVGSREKLRERAGKRVHQYMPASLLDSQFDSLEIPKGAITISVDGSVEETMSAVLKALTRDA